MIGPHQFYLSVIGKGYSEGYGFQCVAGFKEFCKMVLGVDFFGKSMCYGGNPSGYAYRIWYNFDSLGLGKYFEKVPANKMQDGDWAIWNYNSPPCRQSHISMFRKDNGNGTGIFLGQNQGCDGARFSQVNISYNGLLGALRPKIYIQGEKVDQILHKGSKVQLTGTYTVKEVNKKEDTVLINIAGKDCWIKAGPLKEV